MEVTVGSLFSGIGGLDLGLERAGMKVIWQSEIDPYCCKILKKHWPEVPNYGDIKKINWQEIRKPDVICGGYPCQPFSQAGKRQGEKDPRHLWPWVREAISHLQPKYAILENVRGHLTLGGTTVIGELAEIGYDAEWRVVSAAGVGANHRRERIIIVAYPNSQRPHRAQVDTADRQQQTQFELASSSQALAYTNSEGLQGNQRSFAQTAETELPTRRSSNVAYTDHARSRTSERCMESSNASSVLKWNYTQHGFGRRSEIERLSQNWQIEPDVGRVADGIPNRVDRLRGLGNAVVPQVAEYIGRLVMQQYN
jgi:DNA (cytosine-5)-methyltransferase 1